MDRPVASSQPNERSIAAIERRLVAIEERIERLFEREAELRLALEGRQSVGERQQAARSGKGR